MPVGCHHGLAHQHVANGTHEGVVLLHHTPLSVGPQQRVVHTPMPFLQCGLQLLQLSLLQVLDTDATQASKLLALC